MRFACALVLTACTAFGQLTGHGIIAGTVVNATDNTPVRKAIVTLTLQTTPRTWATARTDAAGRFRFENLPAGTYNLEADKNQLGHATYGVDRPGETPEAIKLADDENHDGIRLRFVPSSSLSGTVFDSDGEPLAGAQVTFLQYTRNLGERALAQRMTVVTNERGEYRATNVAPGEYYIVVPSFPRQTVPFETQYYGGAAEAKDASPIHLRSSQNLDRLDFHLLEARLRTIHGRLLGVPDLGLPPPPEADGRVRMDSRGVQIEVFPDEEGLLAPRRALSAGSRPPDYSFSFDVTPGRYRVEASIARPEGNWTATQSIDARQDPGEVILNFKPSVNIPGVLQIEGAPPQPPPAFTISLANRVQSKVASDGTFTLKQVPAGEWAVNINGLPRGAFIKSMQFGASETSDKNVRFDRIPMGGDAKGPLKIVISTRSAKVHGSVDAPGRSGIVLAPTGTFHDFARFYYGATTDDDGKFSIEGVVPGTYRIFALQKLQPAEFRNPETADRLHDLGTDIELKEDASVEVHPQLIPTEQAREALDPALR